MNSDKKNLEPYLDSQADRTIGQLVNSGSYSKSVLDSINSHIIITDNDLKITYINKAAALTWNVQPEKMIGNNLLDSGLYGIPLDLKDNLEAVLKKGKTFNVEAVQYQNPAHEMRFVRLSYTPLFDDRRKVIGVVLVGQDVTRQVSKEKQQIKHIDRLKSELTENRLEIDRLKGEIENKYRFGNLISRSRKMGEIFELILQLADNSFPVLITGETGTGKELIAKAIHYNSRRSKRRLVAINCATLTETLLESELFGHVKGAFTGAIRDKKGKFELADGGSVLLDEIGEMPLITQAKLLRVLQEKRFDKVGGEKTVKVDVRVIAATNQNLEELIENKRFRSDLFYRLNVINIEIPPLRDRLEDIPLLAADFLKGCNRELKKNILFISQGALYKMMHYHWPGNVRELRNIIEKAAVITRGNTLEEVDIPVPPLKPETKLLDYKAPAVSLSEFLSRCEREYLSGQLKTFQGSIAKVSRASGLNRRTIHNKMKKYHLKKEVFK
ncbi:MAG: sigma-54 interaction domain-containing protein [bacterium]